MAAEVLLPADARELRKSRGAFFTPPSIADYLAAWAVGEDAGARILDPSCGDGVFLLAAARRLKELGCSPAELDEQVFGVDLHAPSLVRGRRLPGAAAVSARVGRCRTAGAVGVECRRFLAPAVALSAALQALAAVFSEQLKALRARFWRRHVVVCGLGEKGALIARSFQERGERVVAVERDPDSPQIPAARAEGIVVAVGDAREESVLRRTRGERARHLVAVAGSDATNARIAAQARDLAAGPRAPAVVTAIIHIVARICATSSPRAASLAVTASVFGWSSSTSSSEARAPG